MVCPYCHEDLIYDTEYYSGRPENYCGTAGCGIHYPSTKVVLGAIYTCPRREQSHEDETCESSNFNWFFYTDQQGNLHEGYPC